MPEYKITLNTVASTQITVQADSLEEAVEEAYKEGGPSLCAQCQGWGAGGSPGIELNGDWDADEEAYVKDGEYIDTYPKS
jgi:hypothetical protein